MFCKPHSFHLHHTVCADAHLRGAAEAASGDSDQPRTYKLAWDREHQDTCFAKLPTSSRHVDDAATAEFTDGGVDNGSAAPKSIGELLGEGVLRKAWQKRTVVNDDARRTFDWPTTALARAAQSSETALTVRRERVR